MAEDISPTWCSMAWTHQMVSPGGDVKPCCRFLVSHIPNDNHLRDGRSLKEVFHSDFMNGLRQAMVKGEVIPGCSKCYEEEAAGKRLSIRQMYNSNDHINNNLDINKPELRFLELAFSNLCNIRCVMCHPIFSSSWHADWKRLTGEKHTDSVVNTIDTSLLDTALPHLRHIKFTGGEPLLIPENQALLQKLVDMGISQDVYLNYSTNMTVFASKPLLKLWSQFRRVELALSLDGVGQVLEYVRYPSQWSRVQEVVRQFLALSKSMNVHCGIRPTITVYNVLNLPDVIDWWGEQVSHYSGKSFSEYSWCNPTHADQPPFLSLRVLPQPMKETVRTKLWDKGTNSRVKTALNHICSYMDSRDDSHLVPKFQDYTKRLDTLRKTQFARICPEFASLL